MRTKNDYYLDGICTCLQACLHTGNTDIILNYFGSDLRDDLIPWLKSRAGEQHRNLLEVIEDEAND